MFSILKLPDSLDFGLLSSFFSIMELCFCTCLTRSLCVSLKHYRLCWFHLTQQQVWATSAGWGDCALKSCGRMFGKLHLKHVKYKGTMSPVSCASQGLINCRNRRTLHSTHVYNCPKLFGLKTYSYRLQCLEVTICCRFVCNVLSLVWLQFWQWLNKPMHFSLHSDVFMNSSICAHLNKENPAFLPIILQSRSFPLQEHSSLSCSVIVQCNYTLLNPRGWKVGEAVKQNCPSYQTIWIWRWLSKHISN